MRNKFLLTSVAAILFLGAAPCWGAITKVQNVTNSGTNITSATGLSVTVASTGTGNALVADCNIRDGTPGTDTIAVTDNQSEAWTTPAAGVSQSGALYSIFSFYVLSSTAGVTSVTFKPSGGGGSPYPSMVCDVVEYSTSLSVFQFDLANAITANTSGSQETVSITTTKNNVVVHAAAQNSNGEGTASLSGFTTLDTTFQNGKHMNQHQLNVGPATYAAGFTVLTNAQSYVMTVIAIADVSNPTGSGIGGKGGIGGKAGLGYWKPIWPRREDWQ